MAQVNYTELSREALFYLIDKYDKYVQKLNEDPERGEPVCIREFLNNDFIEILEDSGYLLAESPVGNEYYIKTIY